MNTLGYVGSALVAIGSVAWTMTSAAKRFDSAFDTNSELPAPANDDRAHPEARSRRGFGIGRSMSTLLRKGMPALPVRLRSLPATSLPDDEGGLLDLAGCHYYKRCFICGESLGQYKAFVLRPAAAVSRTCVVPPAHQDCAKFKAANLAARPDAGVVMVWVTREYEILPSADIVQVGLGDAEQVFWYTADGCATRDEVRSSFEEMLPALYDRAHAAGDRAVLELDTMVARATRLFPKHSAAAHVG